MGDEPLGIYLISGGSFEISMPSNIKRIAQDTTDNYFGLDAGVRHQILKKTGIQQDRTLNSVNLVIMEKGEVIGLEECQ